LVGITTSNHIGSTLPKVPFGGVRDSGYGFEGESEAIEAYLNIKSVAQAAMQERAYVPARSCALGRK